LCTDGDFNVGITNRGDLIDLITQEAASGVYLTVLGFGLSNFQDGSLKQLASKGNGNYGYIDTIDEAKKILVEQLSGTLVTIAKDVKIQVEFNPAVVGAYRLIGYENRVMPDEDFNNDNADAGDIGAGHTVTAFYELIPPGAEVDALPKRDPLKYGPPPSSDYEPAYDELLTAKIRYKLPNGTESELIEFPVPANKDELLTVKIRYKLPHENESKLIDFPVVAASVKAAGKETPDFRFAASVAGFGMLLRDSPYKGTATYTSIAAMAQNAVGQDKYSYRGNFEEKKKKARAISKKD
jgi:Ca-activated chloride channel family protein